MEEKSFLDFEQPIVELLTDLETLKKNKASDSKKITPLNHKLNKITQEIFANLNDYQKVRVARHPMRPHTRDYINAIFTDFNELYGDRNCSAGSAIIGGLARMNGEAVMVIGEQKGRDVKENLACHFGMPFPEEYRKALRLMQLAEKFQLPVFTFIDTPGAYPGIDAEERNQSEAIARNLYVMAGLNTPIICTVIGEGGSGGALALGIGDRLLMLEYSIFSTISPEGCASILWKSTEIDKVIEAANNLHLTAEKLFKLHLIDQIVAEPLGGAHRNYVEAASLLKTSLVENLQNLKQFTIEQLLERRYERLRSYGG